MFYIWKFLVLNYANSANLLFSNEMSLAVFKSFVQLYNVKTFEAKSFSIFCSKFDHVGTLKGILVCADREMKCRHVHQQAHNFSLRGAQQMNSWGWASGENQRTIGVVIISTLLLPMMMSAIGMNGLVERRLGSQARVCFFVVRIPLQLDESWDISVSCFATHELLILNPSIDALL